MDATRSEGNDRSAAAAVRRWIARLRPKHAARELRCEDIAELVTAYLEGALDDEMRARFERHLQRCDGCTEYLEQLRVTVHTVGAIRDEQLDPVFLSRLLAAFAETAGSW